MRPDLLESAMQADIAEGPPSALRLGLGRSDEHGRRRPAAGAAQDLPGSRRVVPRRRRVRRFLGARSARSRAAGRPRPGRFDHARPAQVALPAVRVRLPARPPRRVPPQRVRDHPGLPARGRGARARGELLRPRHAAQPHVTGFQGLGLVAVLRARRLPPRDRPQPRPRRARSAQHRSQREARACRRAVARDRLLPAGLRGRRRRDAQHKAHLGARGERARLGVLHTAARPLRDPDVRAEPYHAPGGRRPRARVPPDGRCAQRRDANLPGLRAPPRREPQLGAHAPARRRSFAVRPARRPDSRGGRAGHSAR